MPAATLDQRAVRRAKPLLGTLVEVGVMVGADAADTSAQARIDAAFEAIAQVQRLMSAYDDGSDVGRLHRAAPGQWIDVHPWTAEVLMLAQDWHAWTRGLFDVARGTGRWMCQQDGQRFSAMRLDADCRLDLGGIAKGWAVDRALEAALQLSPSQAEQGAWINAGGDLRCQGVSLPVSLRDEQHGGVKPWLSLSDGALATSWFGEGARASLHGQQRASHVSVAAPTCVLADILTKVVARCGVIDADDSTHPGWLAEHFARLHGARFWVHGGMHNAAVAA